MAFLNGLDIEKENIEFNAKNDHNNKTNIVKATGKSN